MDIPFNFLLPLCCKVNKHMQYKLKVYENVPWFIYNTSNAYFISFLFCYQVGYLLVNNQYRIDQIYAKI